MLAASVRRSLLSAPRPMVARTLATSRMVFSAKPANTESKVVYSLNDVTGPQDLAAPGGKEGEIPTDLEQATGIERLELLGKLQGIEIFDTKPLDASRKGTVADPIVLDSFEDYRYVGCTGSPAGSHEVEWLRPTVDKQARCWECGSVYAVNMVGTPKEDHH